MDSSSHHAWDDQNLGTTHWRDWLRLGITPLLGAQAQRTLISEFGHPCAVFAQPVPMLQRFVTEAQAQSLQHIPPSGRLFVNAFKLGWIKHRQGHNKKFGPGTMRATPSLCATSMNRHGFCLHRASCNMHAGRVWRWSAAATRHRKAKKTHVALPVSCSNRAAVLCLAWRWVLTQQRIKGPWRTPTANAVSRSLWWAVV